MIRYRTWMRLGFLAGVLLLASLAASARADTVAARQVVDQLHEALLESMQAGAGLDHRARVERLGPVIEATHHLPFMARFALGRHAAELEGPQRQAFLEVFRRLSVATYASHFDRYDGQRFEYLSSRMESPEQVIVRTRLVTARGKAVRLDYLVERRRSRWGIVNVLAEGVSDLALRRSDYTRILGESGFDALLEELRRRTDALAERS